MTRKSYNNFGERWLQKGPPEKEENDGGFRKVGVDRGRWMLNEVTDLDSRINGGGIIRNRLNVLSDPMIVGDNAGIVMETTSTFK